VALLYPKIFYVSEAGKNDKCFHKSAGAEEKDIQEGEDRQALAVLRIVLSYRQERCTESILSNGQGQRM
jgi:hypothetical protein